MKTVFFYISRFFIGLISSDSTSTKEPYQYDRQFERPEYDPEQDQQKLILRPAFKHDAYFKKKIKIRLPN